MRTDEWLLKVRKKKKIDISATKVSQTSDDLFLIIIFEHIQAQQSRNFFLTLSMCLFAALIFLFFV